MYTLLRHICGVIDSVLVEVDRGFDFRSGQTKDFEIGICCFSAKHIAWRRKSKDWLAEKFAELALNNNNLLTYTPTFAYQ